MPPYFFLEILLILACPKVPWTGHWDTALPIESSELLYFFENYTNWRDMKTASARRADQHGSKS